MSLSEGYITFNLILCLLIILCVYFYLFLDIYLARVLCYTYILLLGRRTLGFTSIVDVPIEKR